MSAPGIKTGTKDSDLFEVCSHLRAQVVDELERLGVEEEWDLFALLGYPSQSLRNNIQVPRIIREAIHNESVRANCYRLSVKASGSKWGRLVITIESKGGDHSSSAYWEGYNGVRNMLQRVERIEAILAPGYPASEESQELTLK